VVTFDRLPKEELTPSDRLESTGEKSAGYIHDGERESLLGRGEAEPQMAPPFHRILHHAPAYLRSPQ
jgi:hypothetical protein